MQALNEGHNCMPEKKYIHNVNRVEVLERINFIRVVIIPDNGRRTTA